MSVRRFIMPYTLPRAMKKRNIENYEVIKRATGISSKTIFNWVCYGVYPIPDEKIDRLRKYLKISCDDLFFGDDLNPEELAEANRVAEIIEKRKIKHEEMKKKLNLYLKPSEVFNEHGDENQLFLFEGECSA